MSRYRAPGPPGAGGRPPDGPGERPGAAEPGGGSKGREEPEGGEDIDVGALHAAVVREPEEPGEGREPVPWWLWVAAVAVVFWAGLYIGRMAGPFGPIAHSLPPRAAPGGPPTPPAGPPEAPSGEDLYAIHCAACHQAGGTGVPGAFPPLAGSPWVTGDPAVAVRIVLAGLEGPIPVLGQVYQGQMPAWGERLGDEEIAAVVTYVRSAWGNAAAPVTPERVAAERAAVAGRTAPLRAGDLPAPGAEGGSR